jgi:iron complex outermembrane receptor protein
MTYRWAPLVLSMLPAVAQSQSDAPVPSDIPSGDEVVVTATRFEQPAHEIPVGTMVITDEQILRSGVSTLPQLLARQPGITVRDNSGSPDQSVDLRGFGITGDQNTLVLIDGQRLSENELTPARWSTIPLSAIDRIEIVRGSGTVMHGGGATGGVINIITKAAHAGERDFNAYAAYGTYDTLDLRAGGSIAGETMGLTLNGGRYSSDNYRDHNRVQQRNVEAALQTVGPGPGLALKLGADDQDLQLPGARTAAQLETDRRGATTPSDFANRKGWHALTTARFDLGFGELAADLGYRNKDSESSSVFFGNQFNINTKVDTWSFSPRLKIPHHLIGTESTLIAGIDADWWDYDTSRDFGNAHVSAFQRNDAVYAQHSTQFSTGTIVALGGRLQENYMTARDENSGAPYAQGYQTRRPRAYEIGLRQDIVASLAAFAKIGRSFRVATVDEIYNQFGGPFFDPIVTFLEPQTSNDREIGLELTREALFVRASLYYMTLDNEIHFDPSAGPVGNNVNLPPTRRYGAELEGNWRALRWLELGANYTFAVSQFRSGQLNGSDVSGKTVPLVPRHKFTLSGNIDFDSSTRLNAVFSYVGSQFFDGDETNSFGQKIPAYRVFDLKLSHRVGNWTLAASALNLFNEKYFNYGLVVPGTFIAYPQPEQAVFISAEYRSR